MTSKLFKIEVTVNYDHATNVARIVAPKAIRSKIWNLVTNDWFNPGVARYDGNSPTSITLKAYPGYEEGRLVAQMAFAAACFAQVDDFTSLLDDTCVIDRLSPAPEAIDFKPDPAIIMEFQAVVGGYLAIKDLQRRVDELGGINYQAIKNWYDEAVEAFRRLQFADTGNEKVHQNQLDVATANIYRIERIEARAWTMREAKADVKRQLKAAIADFAATIEAESVTEQARNSYHQISAYLKSEQVLLDTEVDAFTQDWDILRVSMDALRKVTPPAPPKK